MNKIILYFFLQFCWDQNRQEQNIQTIKANGMSYKNQEKQLFLDWYIQSPVEWLPNLHYSVIGQ